MAFRDGEKRSHVGRTAECMNDEDGARSGRDRSFYFVWIEIQCRGIDIDKNGRGALHANRIGGGDKGERGNDDLVTCADAEAANTQMQPAGAGVDGDGVLCSNIVGSGVLKGLELRTEAELRCAQNIRHRLDLGLCDVWSGQRNAH